MTALRLPEGYDASKWHLLAQKGEQACAWVNVESGECVVVLDDALKPFRVEISPSCVNAIISTFERFPEITLPDRSPELAQWLATP